jgi:hypothetical protein
MARYINYPDFQTREDCERRLRLDEWLLKFVRAWPDTDPGKASRIARVEERMEELNRRLVELEFEG